MFVRCNLHINVIFYLILIEHMHAIKDISDALIISISILSPDSKDFIDYVHTSLSLQLTF